MKDELVEKILNGLPIAEAARQFNVYKETARRIFYGNVLEINRKLYCQNMTESQLIAFDRATPSKKWEVKVPSLAFLRQNKDAILPQKTCKTCCYFRVKSTEWMGDCVRYPPVNSMFPVVKPDIFCGEWSRK